MEAIKGIIILIGMMFIVSVPIFECVSVHRLKKQIREMKQRN